MCTSPRKDLWRRSSKVSQGVGETHQEEEVVFRIMLTYATVATHVLNVIYSLALLIISKKGDGDRLNKLWELEVITFVPKEFAWETWADKMIKFKEREFRSMSLKLI